MTLCALMFERPIPAPDHLLLASSVVHRFSPCVNLTEPSLSVYHFVPPRILCPDGKKSKWTGNRRQSLDGTGGCRPKTPLACPHLAGRASITSNNESNQRASGCRQTSVSASFRSGRASFYPCCP